MVRSGQRAADATEAANLGAVTSLVNSTWHPQADHSVDQTDRCRT